jgi:hypothetical protein
MTRMGRERLRTAPGSRQCTSRRGCAAGDRTAAGDRQTRGAATPRSADALEQGALDPSM